MLTVQNYLQNQQQKIFSSTEKKNLPAKLPTEITLDVFSE